MSILGTLDQASTDCAAIDSRDEVSPYTQMWRFSRIQGGGKKVIVYSGAESARVWWLRGKTKAFFLCTTCVREFFKACWAFLTFSLPPSRPQVLEGEGDRPSYLLALTKG